MLLSSAKFEKKTQDVLKEELDHEVISLSAEKIAEGRKSDEKISLEDCGEEASKAGMMLYTSGTTNRPVCGTCIIIHWHRLTNDYRKVCCSHKTSSRPNPSPS